MKAGVILLAEAAGEAVLAAFGLSTWGRKAGCGGNGGFGELHPGDKGVGLSLSNTRKLAGWK